MSRVIGCVKWFNNKTGYGFISVDNEDLFAHHAQLTVATNQYKYLVQGEYVEFTKVPVERGNHKFMASDITGVGRGRLMCETRNQMKLDREETP
jgi:CspA family cold shock protein